MSKTAIDRSGRRFEWSFRLPSRRAVTITVVTIILVGIIGLAAWWVQLSNVNSSINRDQYQAVILTNGQVYFGKLTGLSSGYLRLTNVYYLQSKTTNVIVNWTDLQQINKTGQSVNDFQLTKMGVLEIQGPTDEMIIDKDKMLFFENLNKDGLVSQSIIKDQTQK